MLFNPFSLCYGRYENEQEKSSNIMEREIKRLTSKNDLQFPMIKNDKSLKMHDKFVQQMNLSMLSHEMKFNNQKCRFSKRVDENDVRITHSNKVVNGKMYQKISNIPPVKTETASSNMNNINIIVDKLKELECLMEKVLESVNISKDNLIKNANETKFVHQDTKDKIIQQNQTTLSNSLDSSLSSGTSTKIVSNGTDGTGAINNLEIESNSNNINGCIINCPTDDEKIVGVYNELKLRGDSAAINNEILYKDLQCFKGEHYHSKFIDSYQSKYIDQFLSTINDNDYSVDKRIELENIKDWACKSTGIDELGIDDIYSFDDSHQLVTSNLEGGTMEKINTNYELEDEKSNNYELEDEKISTNYELEDVKTNNYELEDEKVGTSCDQELALNNVDISTSITIKCRSKSMPSIDFTDDPENSMASFSSISKLETLSIESDLSICTAS